MSRLRDLFYACLNNEQQNHMHRIVDIEEPAVQIFMTGISVLSVIHRDRYEREKRTVLKENREKLSNSQIDRRLQRD